MASALTARSIRAFSMALAARLALPAVAGGAALEDGAALGTSGFADCITATTGSGVATGGTEGALWRGSHTAPTTIPITIPATTRPTPVAPDSARAPPSTRGRPSVEPPP